MLMYLLTRVLILLAALLALRWLWRLLTSRDEIGRTPRFSKAKPAVGELKQDPQCGTYVSTEISHKTRIDNQELHFCSRKCLDDFLRSRKAASA